MFLIRPKFYIWIMLKHGLNLIRNNIINWIFHAYYKNNGYSYTLTTFKITKFFSSAFSLSFAQKNIKKLLSKKHNFIFCFWINAGCFFHSKYILQLIWKENNLETIRSYLIFLLCAIKSPIFFNFWSWRKNAWFSSFCIFFIVWFVNFGVYLYLTWYDSTFQMTLDKFPNFESV